LKNVGIIDRIIKKILERCGENSGIKGLQRFNLLLELLD
jgi:hypothetical protein